MWFADFGLGDLATPRPDPPQCACAKHKSRTLAALRFCSVFSYSFGHELLKSWPRRTAGCSYHRCAACWSRRQSNSSSATYAWVPLFVNGFLCSDLCADSGFQGGAGFYCLLIFLSASFPACSAFTSCDSCLQSARVQPPWTPGVYSSASTRF